ncbi:hypothetical protein EAH81_24560 [Flavobacterium pectinovorum]|uniref:Uncharacterized protein n=1 Tax=Flavobacterium pectinovorum TaxID=29533 RepID=A0A502EA49_9FLAO|nr:hypothetical protein EAH81_24560 [Flavobacterium pectinovorum]
MHRNIGAARSKKAFYFFKRPRVQLCVRNMFLFTHFLQIQNLCFYVLIEILVIRINGALKKLNRRLFFFVISFLKLYDS